MFFDKKDSLKTVLTLVSGIDGGWPMATFVEFQGVQVEAWLPRVSN